MLIVIGLAFIIILTVLAYRTAKDYERNAVVWGLITFALTFGIQIVIPFIIGIVFVIVLLSSGTPQSRLQQEFDEKVPEFTITIVSMILSVVAGFLVLKHLSKVPEDKPFVAPPAPPPILIKINN